jgi:hypothetical protein
MKGMMMFMPGSSVAWYLPRRSMIFVSDCGIITSVFFSVIMASTKTTINKIVTNSIALFF